MGDVIQFPVSEDDFLKKFKADGLPKELVDCLNNAYKNVILKSKNAPSVEVRVNPEYMKEMEIFRQEYRDFLLSILELLLAKEAEICMLKFDLSKLKRST